MHSDTTPPLDPSPDSSLPDAPEPDARQPVPPHIGTLNEGPLHQALKNLYLTRDANCEVPVDRFVADVVRGTTVYEIQTGSFSGLHRKLSTLLANHAVVLVHPIAAEKVIVKTTRDDVPARRRKSPKHGQLTDIVSELVYIPGVLDHPAFSVEVVLTREEELRVHDPRRVRRRGGWRVAERRLVEVIDRQRITGTTDLWQFTNGPIEGEFTTADLASAMQAPRYLAQKLAYVLREAGAIAQCGKQGNALVYQRAR